MILFKAEKNRKWGIINRRGEEIVPCIHNRLGGVDEGPAIIGIGKELWYIDETGKKVLPCNYNDVRDFREGLASIRKDDKWGFVDKTGKEIIPCIYYPIDIWIRNDDLPDIKNTLSDIYDQVIYYKGYVKVKKDGKWGLLDDLENEILKPMFYDEVELVKVLSDDYVKIILDGRETIVDKDGKIIS